MQKLSRRRLARYAAEQLVAGADRGKLVQQLAAYLVVHKLDKQIELFVSDVSVILAADHGSVLVEVVSARELSASLQSAIREFVKTTESASNVELVNRIDDSLIGGVIIRTPRGEFDRSIKSQLKQLKI
jgi:F-type H+-transporting ATPase subunit delta